MSKKFLAKLLIFCMVFTMLPMTAFGATATGTGTSNGTTYTVTSDVTGTLTVGASTTAKLSVTNATYANSQDTFASATISNVTGNPDYVTVADDGTISVSGTPAITEATEVALTGNVVLTWESGNTTTLSGVDLGTVTVNPAELVETAYTITVTTPENGTVTTDPAGQNIAGTKVTITATPDDGYVVDTITVKDANGTAVDVNDEDNTFTMPASDVTVTVTFKKVVEVEVTPEVNNGTATAEVDAADIVAAVESAAKEDTNVIKIDATSSDTSQEVKTAVVTLPTAAVETLADNGATVTIATNVGTVSLPNELLADNAGADMTLNVAKQDDNKTAGGVETKGRFEVNLTKGKGGEKIPVNGLKTHIELEFNLGTGLTGTWKLAYVDTTDSNKVKNIDWSDLYNSATGIIKGRISHLTEIVVVDPADIVDSVEEVDWSIESATDGAAGGAGKTLIVKLKGEYDGNQVVTFVATTGSGVDANTVATAQTVPTGTNEITYSYGANITKIFVYLTDKLPNLAGKEIGAEIHDSLETETK